MRLTIARLLRSLRRYSTVLAVGGVAAIASAGLQLIGPWAQRLLIDQALPLHRTGDLLRLSGIWGGSLLLAYALRVIGAFAFARSMQHMATDSRAAVMDHAVRLPLNVFTEHGHDQALSLITSDAARVAQDGGALLLSLIMGVAALIGNAVFLWAISPRLTLVAVAVVPVTMLCGNSLMRPLQSMAKVVQDRITTLTAVARDQLDGAKDIRAHSAQAWSSGLVKAASTDYARAYIRRDVVLGAMISTMDLSTMLPLVVAFFVGGRQVIAGSLSVGSLVAFSGYMIRVLEAPQQLMGALGALQPLKVSLDRIHEFLDLPTEESSGEPAREVAPSSLALTGVALNLGGKPVLHDLSLEIDLDHDLAIVGESGSGKTSLISLLVGLLQPTEGQVLVNGEHPLAGCDLSGIRKRIACVFADSHVFGVSMRDNVTLGRPATATELADAYGLAELDALIAGLPNGDGELLQSSGTNLSVGQRQRVALARAMLARPQVIILDEAFASLDANTEMAVWEHLRSRPDRPRIVCITHDLEVAARFERICVMADGTIAQLGTHSELLAQPGVYRTLWESRTA